MSYYNNTDTCDRIKENGKRCGRDFREIAIREYDNEGIWTGNWICNQCHHFLKTYGTTDINKIQQIKSENLFKELENEYGKKFFGDISGLAKCSYDGGIDFVCKNPKEDFIEKYPHLKLEKNKEYKIQLKIRCLIDNCHWDFLLYKRHSKDYRRDIDYFIFCTFDNRDNLNPLHIWIFKNDNIVRGEKFIDRECFSVTNKSKYLLPFNRYEINNIERLKEILRRVDICDN